MSQLALRTMVTVAVATALMLAGTTAPVAGSTLNDSSSMTQDPGPKGDFFWKGYNWERRTSRSAWGPAYNKRYEAANVVGPDAKGYITLKVTNETGQSPVSAEFSTTRNGFGYGTYTTVVQKRLDVMQPELVWGCLFTYDAAKPPGHIEIDVCEASAWGGGPARNQPVVQTHGYWFDASKPPGQGSVGSTFPAGSDPVLTHRLVWAPQRLTYETYAGHGLGGLLLKRTVLTGANVPVPGQEKLHFNFWVFGGNGGSPDRAQPETVVIRDFSFTPAASAEAPTSPETGSTPKAPKNPKKRFSDVSSTSTFHADISSIADAGITHGCGGDRYCPKDVVTREQMASFIVRARGLKPSNANRFVDVSASNVHRADINALAAAGITQGCNPPRNDRYCPTTPVSREQMASFLLRAKKLPSAGGTPFRDVSSSNPHRRDINGLARANVTRSCNPPTNDRFCPKGLVTREQMAAFLNRAFL